MKRQRLPKTHLYRHFRADGALLYVGVSLSIVERTRGHSSTAEWFGAIASIAIETFGSREAALEAEAKAIKDEKPLYNRRPGSFKPPAKPPAPKPPAALAAIRELKPPTPTQLITSRALLGLSMNKLAKEMKAGSQTVVRVETADGIARVNRCTIAAFLRFFEKHGIQFVETDDRVGLTWPRAAEPER